MTEAAGIFSSGMVLQRDKECSIWGKETQADKVQVIFEGNTYEGDVEDGRFLVKVPAHEAATGCEIKICGSSTIVLQDVCFGDVFYLSGQSNMELPVYRTRDVSAEEIDASDDSSIPALSGEPAGAARAELDQSLWRGAPSDECTWILLCQAPV